MSDLFNAGQSPKASITYSAKDIEVLEGLEPVRRRPGMYIGGTDSRAYHHLAAEILDNSMDEAVARHARVIWLRVKDPHTLEIEDDGRGIPIDPHPKFPDKSALEVIMTTLHSGGKFTNSAYATSGGLHGVGLSVVNALSSLMHIQVFRDGFVHEQTYKKGVSQSALIVSATEMPKKRGTCITFTPDAEIFGEKAAFNPATLLKMARSKAYLFKGVEIRWSCPKELCTQSLPEKTTLCFPNGLYDYLQETLDAKTQVIDAIFHGDYVQEGKPQRLEWAITWTDADENMFRSYCNTVYTPQGGTHETGFRQALLKSLKAHGERRGNKRASILAIEDVTSGLTGVISVFIANPQFQGQTKEKLTTTDTTKYVETAVRETMDQWLSHNLHIADDLLEHLISLAEERKRRKASKETLRQTATKRLRLPGKLVDCTATNSDETEIFLLEGDSAGGTAKQARIRKTQAILPLRGKILNVASATLEKMFANQEIKDLALAIGIGLGKDCKLDNLRYGKVVILTDADTDGAHIASLLLTFFYMQMRPLLANGHVYLACPPLYRLRHGSKKMYARDDAHKEELMKTFPVNAAVEVTRFKGLGEMDWPDLKLTTTDPETRTLLKVTLADPLKESNEESPEEIAKELEGFMDDLMGRKPEKRFQFIQENASFVENLDV
ncbi:MAG: DNA topoisomerase IV subunit B [Alphaproteobacteria bacterium]|nr:MAG: DNA topoisomerase IV subunit B [Alphaproteobacteria bacterium]